jgi:hypothetical protein
VITIPRPTVGSDARGSRFDCCRCDGSWNGSGPSASTPEPHGECSWKEKQTQRRGRSAACNTSAPGGGR